MILGRARAPFVCVMYTLDISRDVYTDVYSEWRLGGRAAMRSNFTALLVALLMTTNIIFPLSVNAIQHFVAKKVKANTEVIVLLSLRYASAKRRSLLDRDAKIGLMMRYNSSSKFTSDIFIQRNVADTSINAEEFLREGRHYIKLDLYLTLVP